MRKCRSNSKEKIIIDDYASVKEKDPTSEKKEKNVALCP